MISASVFLRCNLIIKSFSNCFKNVIISPSEYFDDLAPFINWKKQSGRDVVLVDISGTSVCACVWVDYQ